MARGFSDAGLSLIEVMVAVLLIALVVAPAADFLIQSTSATGVEHLQLEASNVASSAIESLQAEAAQGQLLPLGTTALAPVSISENGSRSTKFSVTADVEAVQQGTNQSICTSDASVLQQIWTVKVTVVWPQMHGAPPVVRTTEIAPAQAGAVQQSADELAVRLTVDGTSTNLFTHAPGVNATVTGTWGGGGSHLPPFGTLDSEGPENSGSSGCLVFENLDPTPGMTYTVSFNSNPSIVTDQEFASANPTGAPTIGPLTLQPGVPNIQTLQVDVGTTLNIQYAGPIKGPGGTCPVVATPPLVPATTSPIPLSLENSFLTSYTNDTWVAYSGSVPLTSLLLFPWPSNTLMWAGDQPDSSPTSVYGASGPAACSVDDTDRGALGGTVTVYLPLYPLKLTVSNSPTSLTATEVAGNGRSFALNAPLATSATSLPLGEYSLSDQRGSLNTYVWVTPSGECTDTAGHPTPPSPCTGTTLPVTG